MIPTFPFRVPCDFARADPKKAVRILHNAGVEILFALRRPQHPRLSSRTVLTVPKEALLKEEAKLKRVARKKRRRIKLPDEVQDG
jgi:hypothetical protein